MFVLKGVIVTENDLGARKNVGDFFVLGKQLLGDPRFYDDNHFFMMITIIFYDDSHYANNHPLSLLPPLLLLAPPIKSNPIEKQMHANIYHP